jgi:hypothetical protein
MKDEYGWLWTPVLWCKRPRDESDPDCPRILLPYSGRALSEDKYFQLEDANPSNWPPDEWSAIFGCSTCGFVSQYLCSDIFIFPCRTAHPGLFHSGANCFCITFLCAYDNCKTRTNVYVEKQGASEGNILDLFREPFFIGSLPCGHPIVPLPRSEYQIGKVMDPIA